MAIKQYPLVTIVTPSYNQGEFIQYTIESVLAQDYPNIEYIIVDGGSTDQTIDILKKYEGKVKIICEPDKGQSDAINKGFKAAKGEILAWLNSDDIYIEGCITKAVEQFQTDSKLGLVYGEGYDIDAKGAVISRFHATQPFDMWTLINVWDYILQPTTFFRSEYLKAVGYLDIQLNWCMDWDLWIKLALISNVSYIPEFLACSRIYGNTKTSTGGKKRLEEIRKLMQKYSQTENPLGYRLYKWGEYSNRCSGCKPIKFVIGRYLRWTQKRIFANRNQ